MTDPNNETVDGGIPAACLIAIVAAGAFKYASTPEPHPPSTVRGEAVLLPNGSISGMPGQTTLPSYVIDNVAPFDGNCISTDNAGTIKGIEPCTRTVAPQACTAPSKLDDNGDFCVSERAEISGLCGFLDLDGIDHCCSNCSENGQLVSPPIPPSPYISIRPTCTCRWADRDGHEHDDGTCYGGGFPPGGNPGDVLTLDGKGGWKWVPLPPGVGYDKDGNLIETNPQ